MKCSEKAIQGMSRESESVALPFGDSPIYDSRATCPLHFSIIQHSNLFGKPFFHFFFFCPDFEKL